MPEPFHPSPRAATLASLRSVAEAVPEALVGTDAAGVVTLWAGGATGVFGWEAEEVVGRPVEVLLPGVALSSAEPVRTTAVRKDGTTFPAELTVTLGTTGAERLHVLVVRDRTADDEAARDLRVAEQRLRTAFEHAPIGMVMLSPAGRMLTANDAFAALVDRPREELSGIGMCDVTHPEDRRATTEAFAALVEGREARVRNEKRYVRPDGAVVWADVAIALVRDDDGTPLHFIKHAVDITERRRIAQELERSNAELAQFADAASHDLNEPLRIVDGFLALLERRSGDRLDEDGQRFVAHARIATGRMRELIDAFLRYARAGSGDELAATTLALEQVAREGLTALGAALAERRVTVHLEDLPPVRGDAALLRQVFQNLLGNAIRHAAPEAGRVRVTAVVDGDEVEVSVADNGRGIPPADRERVFDAFIGSGQGAAGLGLAICRRVIERHGGRMWVQDADLGGADVRFRLPRA